MSTHLLAAGLSTQVPIGWAAVSAAALAMGWMAACAARILRRLPEPVDPAPGDGGPPAAPPAGPTGRAVRHPVSSRSESTPSGPSADIRASAVKIAYRDLATRRFVIGCVVVAGCSGALFGAAVPYSHLPLWLVLATIGVLLAAVDLATTWLPRRLCHLAWLAVAMAIGLCLLLGAGLDASARAGIGAVVAGGVYWLIWLVSRGGIGFGDVRFAPLIGAPAAADSWTLLIWALLAGSLIGAVHGLIRLARRQERSFPYAPAMLLGACVALLATRLG